MGQDWHKTLAGDGVQQYPWMKYKQFPKFKSYYQQVIIPDEGQGSEEKAISYLNSLDEAQVLDILDTIMEGWMEDEAVSDTKLYKRGLKIIQLYPELKDKIEATFLNSNGDPMFRGDNLEDEDDEW